MQAQRQPAVPISATLLDALAGFPLEREVSHCAGSFTVSPFDIYATCPRCGTRLKVRAFSAGPELEDVFDAVFAWMNRPGACELAQRRRQEIAADTDD
jgi:hypothetical protein